MALYIIHRCAFGGGFLVSPILRGYHFNYACHRPIIIVYKVESMTLNLLKF